MTSKNNIIDNDAYNEMFGDMRYEKKKEEICKVRLECELPCRRCMYFDKCTKYEKSLYLFKSNIKSM